LWRRRGNERTMGQIKMNLESLKHKETP
jgi:hypothetical protein